MGGVSETIAIAFISLVAPEMLIWKFVRMGM